MSTTLSQTDFVSYAVDLRRNIKATKTDKWIAMRKAAFIISVLITVSGCEVGRRAYLSVTHRVVRNVTDAMLPNIKAGDYLVIDKTYYSSKPIQRFDLVVLKHPGGGLHYPEGAKNPDGTDLHVVKRVVALGGETVEIHAGKLYVNGSELNQAFPIVPHEDSEEFGPYTVPAGEYFLLGDNRRNSEDSRYYERHSVDKRYIVAKVTEVLPG